MLLSRYLLGCSLAIFMSYANADSGEINTAIINGLHYIKSVQLAYGEFPTIFYPNISEPRKTQEAKYDSNIFSSAMIADAIYPINSSIANTIW